MQARGSRAGSVQGSSAEFGTRVVALDDDEGSVVVRDELVLVDEDAEVDREPVPRRLVLEVQADRATSRNLRRLVGVEARPVAGVLVQAVGSAVVDDDGAPAVGEGDLLLLVVAVVAAELDEVASAEEVRQVRARDPVLEALEVVDVVAQAGHAVAEAPVAEVSDASGVDGVEGRLVRDRNGRHRALRVVVVVELELQVELRCDGPVAGEDGDAVDLLRGRAGRGRRVEVDRGVVLVDAPVAERRVEEQVGGRSRRQLAEVLLDVEVRVGQGAGQVGAVLFVHVVEVDRAVPEQTILQDRPADADARPKAVGLGLNVRVLAVGLEAGRLIVEPRLAVDEVRARLGHAVDDEPAGAAVLRRDARARDVDLLDVELGEVLVEVAEEGVRHVDAVVEESVVLAPAGRVDADVRVGDLDAAVDDAGSELEGAAEGAGERQLLDRFALGDLRDVRGLGVDERSGRGHGDLLGRGGSEHGPDLGDLREADDDLLLEHAEALELGPELVRAGDQVQELEDAVDARRRGAAERHLRSGDRDEDARQRRPFAVPSHALDRAGGLGEDSRGEEHGNENGGKRNPSLHEWTLLQRKVN